MLSKKGSYTAREAVVGATHTLLAAAESERLRANHYNGVHFGAAILGLTKSDRFDLFTGHNYQPFKRDHDEDHAKPKICAEQYALLNGEAGGLSELLALAIVGELMKDDKSKLATWASHMCRFCRPNFDSHSAVSRDSIFISENPELDIVEVWKVGEIIDLHKKRRGPGDIRVGDVRNHVISKDLAGELVLRRIIDDKNPLLKARALKHPLGFNLRESFAPTPAERLT